MKQSLDVDRTGHGRFGDFKTSNVRVEYYPSRELTYPPDKAYLKMIFLFPRWDMLIPWRVLFFLVVVLLTYVQVCQHVLWDWPTRR